MNGQVPADIVCETCGHFGVDHITLLDGPPHCRCGCVDWSPDERRCLSCDARIEEVDDHPVHVRDGQRYDHCLAVRYLDYGTPVRVLELGQVRLEFYSATTVDEPKVRVRHHCWTYDGRETFAAPELCLREGLHTILNADPITVTPSIDCPNCELHGFITDGAWVDAGNSPANPAS